MISKIDYLECILIIQGNQDGFNINLEKDGKRVIGRKAYRESQDLLIVNK